MFCRKRGFTVIELLVVVVIIALLMVMLLPVMLGTGIQEQHPPAPGQRTIFILLPCYILVRWFLGS